jgi:tetratricopeptide (TPR) repeat protein
LFYRLGEKRQRRERFSSHLRAALSRLDEVAEVAWVHIELGPAQATIGALPEAELSLSRALELGLDNRAEAHAARATCRLRRERFADAHEDACALVDLTAHVAAGHRILGDVLRASDDLTGAVEAYGRAIARSDMADDEHRLSRFRRGECCAELGRHADALEDFTALLETGFRQRARLGRARSLEALGRLREALADWEHARDGGAREANAAIVQIQTALAIGGSLRAHDGGDASGVRAGDRVQHAKFGPGLVLEVDDQGERPRAIVRFDDEAAGEKALLVQFLTPLR